MDWISLAGQLALEAARYLNTPEAEGWAKEILNLEKKKFNENLKPPLEDRDIFPDLKSKDFRNDLLIVRIDNRLFQLGKAIATSSRGSNGASNLQDP